jgi:hypothetical protein
MGFINLAEKTIHAKLVYYGVGMGGKTTSLQQASGPLAVQVAAKIKIASRKTPANPGAANAREILLLAASSRTTFLRCLSR